MKEMQNESINCCITSPPYWALRDYGAKSIIWDEDKNCKHIWGEKVEKKQTGGSVKNWLGKDADRSTSLKERSFNVSSQFCSKCEAWKGSLGLEPTFDLYIKHLCNIFDEVKRTLRKDGTCWIVIGDTYSGNRSYQVDGTKQISGSQPYKQPKINLQSKSLVMIPFRFAIEMVNRGWILRNTIIWYKPNCMPASVKDRFTVDFEYVFFFVKNKKYWFEQQFEKYDKPLDRWGGPTIRKSSHKYIEVGEPKIGKLGATSMFRKGRPVRPNEEGRNKRCIWRIIPETFKEAHFAVYPPELIRTPIKAGCPENGITLDPFAGSGTTAEECRKLGRKCVCIEINKSYCNMIVKRLAQEVLDFSGVSND